MNKNILCIVVCVLAILLMTVLDSRGQIGISGNAAFVGAAGFAAASGGGGTVTATDSFNRANADPMSTTMSDSSSTWDNGVDAFNIMKILGNACVASADASYCGARVASPTFSANQKATVVLKDVAATFYSGVMVRIQGTADNRGYLLFNNGTGFLQLFKLTAAGATTKTQIGSDITVTGGTGTAGVLAAGDSISLEAIGTTIKAFVNSTEILSTTDATYASGQPGIFAYYELRGQLESFTATER